MEKYSSELMDETSVDKYKFVNNSADRDVFLDFGLDNRFSINLVYLKGNFHLFLLDHFFKKNDSGYKLD